MALDAATSAGYRQGQESAMKGFMFGIGTMILILSLRQLDLGSSANLVQVRASVGDGMDWN
jgi:hypothetical protein